MKVRMLGKLGSGVCAAIAVALPALAADDCRSIPKVKPQTSLTELSSSWFGNNSYRFAIMLATNARVSESRFSFIGDPNNLPKGTASAPNHVCIPTQAEADNLRRAFDIYLDAVHDMALAEPSEIVSTLDPVPAGGPVQFVSWIRQDQANRLPAVGSNYTTTGATWVTLTPKLQEFCTDYVANHSDDPEAVTHRIEQRLGLPPKASKTHFATFEIATPADGVSVFRPCGDTEVTDTTCKLGPHNKCDDKDTICHKRRDFFFEQYYNSYGTARPVEYPWTSLGYTFDWARGPVGAGGRSDFVKVGESEYVVPAKVTMKLVSVSPTMDYCTGG